MGGMSPMARLQRALRGPMLVRDHPAYEVARTTFNAMTDRHPAVIACCAGAELASPWRTRTTFAGTRLQALSIIFVRSFSACVVARKRIRRPPAARPRRLDARSMPTSRILESSKTCPPPLRMVDAVDRERQVHCEPLGPGDRERDSGSLRLGHPLVQ